jgi:V/A-type H+-transporting ATPase subunit E
MTLESMIRTAHKQGQEEIDIMHKATGKEVLAILDAATKEIEAMTEEAKAWAESEAKRLGIGKVSSANLEARKLMLKSKAEVLAMVKEGVIKRMRGLSIIERERVIRKLLARARKHIPEGTVCVRQEDLDILKENMGSYRIGPIVNISGGIIVDSSDRKRRIDLSFDSILEDVWERNARELSSFLFKEGSE